MNRRSVIFLAVLFIVLCRLKSSSASLFKRNHLHCEDGILSSDDVLALAPMRRSVYTRQRGRVCVLPANKRLLVCPPPSRLVAYWICREPKTIENLGANTRSATANNRSGETLTNCEKQQNKENHVCKPIKILDEECKRRLILESLVYVTKQAECDHGILSYYQIRRLLPLTRNVYVTYHGQFCIYLASRRRVVCGRDRQTTAYWICDSLKGVHDINIDSCYSVISDGCSPHNSVSIPSPIVESLNKTNETQTVKVNKKVSKSFKNNATSNSSDEQTAENVLDILTLPLASESAYVIRYDDVVAIAGGFTVKKQPVSIFSDEGVVIIRDLPDANAYIIERETTITLSNDSRTLSIRSLTGDSKTEKDESVAVESARPVHYDDGVETASAFTVEKEPVATFSDEDSVIVQALPDANTYIIDGETTITLSDDSRTLSIGSLTGDNKEKEEKEKEGESVLINNFVSDLTNLYYKTESSLSQLVGKSIVFIIVCDSNMNSYCDPIVHYIKL